MSNADVAERVPHRNAHPPARVSHSLTQTGGLAEPIARWQRPNEAVAPEAQHFAKPQQHQQRCEVQRDSAQLLLVGDDVPARRRGDVESQPSRSHTASDLPTAGGSAR